MRGALLPVVVRSKVVSVKVYGEFRDSLRYDFWFSCAYCTLTEVEGQTVAFEIDHYLPKNQFADLMHDYENLYYSCKTCNGKKGTYWASPESASKGREFIRVDREHPREHLAESLHDPTEITGITPKGEFNVLRLALNRDALKNLRALRQRYSKAKQRIAFLVGDLNRNRPGAVDALPRHMRLYFLDLRRQAQACAREADEISEEFWRECLHSPFAGPPPTPISRRLVQVGAIVPIASNPGSKEI